MANAIYPFICIQENTKSTVNISVFIHAIILKSPDDENPMVMGLTMPGRSARHINANSQREVNIIGRRPISVLSAMNIKNAAMSINMHGITMLRKKVEFIYRSFSFSAIAELSCIFSWWDDRRLTLYGEMSQLNGCLQIGIGAAHPLPEGELRFRVKVYNFHLDFNSERVVDWCAPPCLPLLLLRLFSQNAISQTGIIKGKE